MGDIYINKMRILLNPDYKETERMRFDYFRKDVIKTARKECKLLDISYSQLNLLTEDSQIEQFGIDIKNSLYKIGKRISYE